MKWSMPSDSAWLITVLGFPAALVLSTIWHELGHFVVARLYRVPVRLIVLGLGPTLWRRTLPGDLRLEVRALPLGVAVGVLGRRTADGHPRRPISHDFAIAAGGPTASLIFSAILLVLAFLGHPGPTMGLWLVATALISALLAGMNLLPIPGLDGGHLVMLTLAHFGWQFSPQREVALQRLGIRLTTGLCVLFVLSAWVVRVR
jgi:membrane-associated protease RseP (regulator of RpoE activity)